MIKIFQYVLKPTEGQRQTIHIFAGASRFVFNKGLIYLKEMGAPRNGIDYEELYTWLEDQLKSVETPWLTSVPLVLLQNSISDLIEAHQVQEENASEPLVFRKKGRTDAFYFRTGIALDYENSKVLVPDIGWVSFSKEGEIAGKLEQVTLRRRGPRWFVELSMLMR